MDTLGSIDELAADTARREGLGDVAGLQRCMEGVRRFEYFDDAFSTLAATDKDWIRKHALKRYHSQEERHMQAAVQGNAVAQTAMLRQGVTALKELPGAIKKKGGALAQGNVTAEMVRSLKAMIRPLGGAEKLPKRKTLTDWWRQVRFALEAVDTGVVVEQLERDVLERIGHILLGEAAWELICRQPFINWATLVGAVERRFGGSEAH